MRKKPLRKLTRKTARTALLLQLALIAPLWVGCEGRGDSAPIAEAQAQREPGVYPAESPSLRHLQTSPVRRATGERELPAVGRVTFDEARVVNITTPLAGRVTQLKATVGTVVKKGQVLVVLDSPEITAVRADLRKALVDLSAADKNLERVKLLVAEKAAARKDELSAEVDRQKALAEVSRLRSRLALLGKKESDHSAHLVLRAPRSGVVVKRSVNVGEEVRPDSPAPLLVLADLSVVWVLAEIPERELALVRLAKGAQVELTSFPGQKFRGAVKHIGDVVMPETRTIQVRIELENKDRLLKPEMYARVSLDLPRGEAPLLVPTRALVTRKDATVVFVQEAPGKFVARPVVVGSELGNDHEVVKGLKDGELVVTQGALLLDAEFQRVL